MCCRLWLKLFNKRPGYLFVRAVTMLKQQNYPGHVSFHVWSHIQSLKNANECKYMPAANSKFGYKMLNDCSPAAQPS